MKGGGVRREVGEGEKSEHNARIAAAAMRKYIRVFLCSQRLSNKTLWKQQKLRLFMLLKVCINAAAISSFFWASVVLNFISSFRTQSDSLKSNKLHFPNIS